jgi:hypothetical protein
MMSFLKKSGSSVQWNRQAGLKDVSPERSGRPLGGW